MDVAYYVYTERMEPEQVEAFEAYLEGSPTREAPSRAAGVTFATLYGEVE